MMAILQFKVTEGLDLCLLSTETPSLGTGPHLPSYVSLPLVLHAYLKASILKQTNKQAYQYPLPETNALLVCLPTAGT